MSENAELLSWFSKQIYFEIQRPRNIGAMSISGSPISTLFFKTNFEDKFGSSIETKGNKKVLVIGDYTLLEFLLGSKQNWIEVDAIVQGKKDGYYKINSPVKITYSQDSLKLNISFKMTRYNNFHVRAFG